MSADNASPIGVFDSGIGGLTVCKEILRLLPSESLLYLGDTARVPYGVRSPDTVRRYALEGMGFLVGKGIKLLVVACNTVSAVCLDELAAEMPVPVIGVLKPGARAAAAATRSGRVGIIGTPATIRSGSYQREIQAIAPDVVVSAAACPLFVPLAEEGWFEGEVPELAAKKYLLGLKDEGIDTLVLGCTHYPLLSDAIAKVMGPDIGLIDSARETAAEVKRELAGLGLESTGKVPAEAEFYVTDAPGNFKDIGESFIGRKLDNIYEVYLEGNG